ncbi:GvpL/GvpF family gas vesicle protein [Planktothrix sp. FACHB-1355]|uniref:GvpL/GvpF family gas vesicle protein n=1 Tax=Aerosakkonema funiforme FACHB-1375 TaxID=2949571 RepID=A0A926ZGF2_9CYAN|nr:MULTISPECIES: GvpL/GvpF family gas vesicle protein [Oscillatoriales]MBD2181910.1 GvpL/GvpF family gas vesicle protein [Aerosakkonema funiforme FACHB-1375]MBD3561780.1 GvpL/GvpF family gas vesicle protein [Planktothrix sp. FACHB-1355]
MSKGFYLYGILTEPLPESIKLEGMDKLQVYSHKIDIFNFLYSEAKQEKYLTSRRNLLCHEKVLEDAMKEGFRTLIPLRFGLAIKTWETVSEQLTIPYKEKLLELFDKLDGRREVSVKVLWNNNSEIQALLASNPTLKEKRDAMEGRAMSMDGVIEIGQMIESGLQARKEEVIDLFRDELNALAEEVIESDTMTEEMIYNAAYLIPWDSESQFGEKVEAIDLKFGDRLRIRYNNFTAPYTFAQLS